MQVLKNYLYFKKLSSSYLYFISYYNIIKIEFNKNMFSYLKRKLWKLEKHSMQSSNQKVYTIYGNQKNTQIYKLILCYWIVRIYYEYEYNSFELFNFCNKSCSRCSTDGILSVELTTFNIVLLIYYYMLKWLFYFYYPMLKLHNFNL